MGKRKLSGSRNHICGSAGTAAWGAAGKSGTGDGKRTPRNRDRYTGSGWDHEESLPENRIQPVYAVVLEDTIRKNARETLDFFRKEGVDVKVISGDHVKTVSMIAKRAGLNRWADALDMSALEGKIDYDRICRILLYLPE